MRPVLAPLVLVLLAACGGATTDGGAAEPVETRPDCPVVAACGACEVFLCGAGAAVEYVVAGQVFPCHTGETCADVYPEALAACGAFDDGSGFLCPDGTPIGR